jgi:hypothetical protein
VTLLRKAGILPPSDSEEVEFSDWQYILNKLSLDDQEELRKIAEMKIERRKKEQGLKALKAKKAER